MPYADVTKRKLNTTWKNIINRCLTGKHISYKYYGARGITVCDEWKTFDNFYLWALENGYKQGLSIDRIDNNGNYEPANCRWATPKEQALNTRSNHRITYKNETKTVSEWADQIGISFSALEYRLKSENWTLEEALTTGKNGKPVEQKKFRKKVVQLSLDKEEIKVWDSISEASTTLKIPNSNISRALTEKRRAGGYYWEYKK